MALGARGRRWLIALAVLAGLSALGAWWINRQLEPQRLTAWVLGAAGKSLGLDLRFEGTPDYAFKPEPRLLIPNLQVRNRNDGKLFVSAARAEISLPWNTLTGGKPVITRIELDQPVLDIPELRRWLAARPKVPFELPTLTHGMRVSAGTLDDDGYRISQFALDLPHLKTGDPAQVSVSGTFTQEQTIVEFAARITMATPGLQSDFTLDGSGALKQQPQPLPFKLQMAGRFLSDDASFSLDADSLKLDGASPLPSLSGKAQLKLAEQTQFGLDAVLLEWPKDWPALPQPLAANSGNLPLRLSYLGKSDLSDPLSLNLVRDATRLQASLRIPQIQQWLDAPAGSPLPPLNATLSTPKLEMDDIELEGVQVEIRDDVPAAPSP